MKGARERKKQVIAMIEVLGFKCEKIEISGSGHIRCFIEDDAGNKFKGITAFSTSNARRSLLNFKSDIRKTSLRAKGVIQ